MGSPRDFAFTRSADGTVTITHRGHRAATLRGARANKFAAQVEGRDPQGVMARWTGQYRRGNERVAARHPRNSGRGG
jgi:hypothetical protein